MNGSDKTHLFSLVALRQNIKSDMFTEYCNPKLNVQEYFSLNKKLSGEINIIWALNATNKEEQTLIIKKKS